MKKNYRKIKFGVGDSIEKAMNDLAHFNKCGELVYGEFNGQMLYSDIDDMDSAYKKITGITKKEFDVGRQKEADEYEQELCEHKEAIPKLTKEWIDKGEKTLDAKYHDLWAKAVPIRLDDLYQGMELGCCLDLVDALNKDYDFEYAKDILDKQKHSGMSYGLVCSMVRSFCDRGKEFVRYINKPN